MEKFNRAIEPHLQQNPSKGITSPAEFFLTVYDQMIEKYKIFEDYDKLQAIKDDLIVQVRTSNLSPNQKDSYEKEITDIDDYARLFLFF